jgi:hypothetical protein
MIDFVAPSRLVLMTSIVLGPNDVISSYRPETPLTVLSLLTFSDTDLIIMDELVAGVVGRDLD